MDMGTEANVVINANNERNAKAKAINKCYDKGYFHVEVLSCEDVTEDLKTTRGVMYD